MAGRGAGLAGKSLVWRGIGTDSGKTALNKGKQLPYGG